MYQPENPLLTVDLFVTQPIPYEELDSRAITMKLDDIKVRVCSIGDLIAMKNQAGREKDLADIKQLARIKKYEKKQSN